MDERNKQLFVPRSSLYTLFEWPKKKNPNRKRKFVAEILTERFIEVLVVQFWLNLHCGENTLSKFTIKTVEQILQTLH